MTTAAPTTQPTVEPTDHDDEDDLDHVVCKTCNPNRALCGTDMTDTTWTRWWHRFTQNAADLCVVCLELENLPCPRCGN